MVWSSPNAWFRLTALPVALAMLGALGGCIPGVSDATNGLSFSGGSFSPYIFAYVAGPTGTVSQLKVNVATGQITHNGYVYGGEAASNGILMLSDPQSQFGIAVFPDILQVFSIDSGTGKLSIIPAGGPLPGMTLSVTANASYAVMHPAGGHIYVSSSFDGGVYSVDIDNAGNLTNPNFTPIGSQPVSLTFDPSGNYLYVSDVGSAPGNLYSVPVNSDGTLGTPSAPVTVTGSISLLFLTLHPNGKFAYVMDAGNSSVYAFAVGSGGALTPIDALLGGATPGNPFPLPGVNPGAFQFIVHPSGTFGYSPNPDPGTPSISILNIDPSTGGLTATLPQVAAPANSNSQWLRIDPSGSRVYLVDMDSSDITTYDITDQTTGALAQARTLNLPFGPIYLGLVNPPSPVNLVPRLAFVLGNSSSTLKSYLIDPTSGGLTFAASSSVGVNPVATVVHPCGCFVYVLNLSDQTVSGFIVDPDTGTLAPISTFNLVGLTSPVSMAMDPAGAFLFVMDNASGNGNQFTIAQDTGSLTFSAAISSSLSAINPTGIVADPSGQGIFAADNDSTLGFSDASYYTTDPTFTFAPSWSNSNPSASADTGPSGLDVDPGGRILYIPNTSSNTLSTFFWDQFNGAFTSVTTPPIPGASNSLTAVAVHPSGKWVYTLISTSINTLVTAAIDQVSATPGGLTIVQGGVQAGTNAMVTSMSIEPTGHFLYVADNVPTGDIYIYSIDQSTGALTLSSKISTGDNALGMATWGGLRLSTALGCSGCGQITTSW